MTAPVEVVEVDMSEPDDPDMIEQNLELLREYTEEIKNADLETFNGRLEELKEWLADDRAYETQLQQPIMKLFSVIYNQAKKHEERQALAGQLFDVVLKHGRVRFAKNPDQSHWTKIERWAKKNASGHHKKARPSSRDTPSSIASTPDVAPKPKLVDAVSSSRASTPAQASASVMEVDTPAKPSQKASMLSNQAERLAEIASGEASLPIKQSTVQAKPPASNPPPASNQLNAGQISTQAPSSTSTQAKASQNPQVKAPAVSNPSAPSRQPSAQASTSIPSQLKTISDPDKTGLPPQSTQSNVPSSTSVSKSTSVTEKAIHSSTSQDPKAVPLLANSSAMPAKVTEKPKAQSPAPKAPVALAALGKMATSEKAKSQSPAPKAKVVEAVKQGSPKPKIVTKSQSPVPPTQKAQSPLPNVQTAQPPAPASLGQTATGKLLATIPTPPWQKPPLAEIPTPPWKRPPPIGSGAIPYVKPSAAPSKPTSIMPGQSISADASATYAYSRPQQQQPPVVASPKELPVIGQDVVMNAPKAKPTQQASEKDVSKAVASTTAQASKPSSQSIKITGSFATPPLPAAIPAPTPKASTSAVNTPVSVPASKPNQPSLPSTGQSTSTSTFPSITATPSAVSSLKPTLAGLSAQSLPPSSSKPEAALPGASKAPTLPSNATELLSQASELLSKATSTSAASKTLPVSATQSPAPILPTGSSTQALPPVISTPSTSVIPASRPASDSPAEKRPAKRSRTHSPLPERNLPPKSSVISTASQPTLPVPTSVPVSQADNSAKSQASQSSGIVAASQAPSTAAANPGTQLSAPQPTMAPKTGPLLPAGSSAGVQPSSNSQTSAPMRQANSPLHTGHAANQLALSAGLQGQPQTAAHVQQQASPSNQETFLIMYGGRSGGQPKKFIAPVQITAFPAAFLGTQAPGGFRFTSTQQAEAFIAFSISRRICSPISRFSLPQKQNPYSIEVHGCAISEYVPNRQPDFLLDGNGFTSVAHFQHEVEVFLAGYHASIAYAASPFAFFRFNEVHPGARLTQLGPRISNAPQDLATYGELIVKHIHDAGQSGPPQNGSIYGFGLWAVPGGQVDGPSLHGEIWQGLFVCLRSIYRVARHDAAQFNTALMIIQKITQLCLLFHGGDIALSWLRKFEEQLRSLVPGAPPVNSPLALSTSSFGSAPHSRSHSFSAPQTALANGQLDNRPISPAQVVGHSRQNSLTQGSFDSTRRASAPVSRVASPVNTTLPPNASNLGIGLPASGLRRPSQMEVVHFGGTQGSRAASQPVLRSTDAHMSNGDKSVPAANPQVVGSSAASEDVVMNELPQINDTAQQQQTTAAPAELGTMQDLLLKVQQKFAAEAPKARSPSPPPASIAKFYQRDEVVLEEQDVPGERPTITFQFDADESLLDRLKADAPTTTTSPESQLPKAFLVLTCSSAEAETKWPAYGWFLQINDINISLPNGTIEKSHRTLVSSHLQKKNNIRLIRMLGCKLPEDTVLSVEVGTTLSRDRLLEQTKKLRDATDEARLFKDALGDRTELEVSLKDLQSGRRVATPVRGQQCSHPEAFDLDAWLDAVVDTDQDEVSPCLKCGSWLSRADLRFCDTTQTKLNELTDDNVMSYKLTPTSLAS